MQYGDVFTFILLGKKTTVCLGTKGNDFILNGKLKDVNADVPYKGLPNVNKVRMPVKAGGA